MKPLVTRLFIALLAAILFAAMMPMQKIAARAFESAVEEDERYYLPPAAWLRIFCLGYNEAAADLVWVKTIVHFGKNLTAAPKKSTDPFVLNYLMTAVELDRRFRSLYTVGSTLTMFQNHGVITRHSLDMAIELLERGTKEFPGDGEIFFSLGYIHHYEMLNFVPDDPKDPITEKHLRLGRYYFSRAALMDNAPPYATLLSASLMQRFDMAEMVVEHLKAMLLRETDPQIRAQLIGKLREEAGRAAERDILQTEQLQQEWRKQLPFVPFDFFLVLRSDAPIEEFIDPLYLTDQLLEETMPDADEAAADIGW
jgi:hypothetical protein